MHTSNIEVINVCKVKVLNLQRKDYKHFCSGILAMNEIGRLWSQPKPSIYTQFLRTLIPKNKVLESKKLWLARLKIDPSMTNDHKAKLLFLFRIRIALE